MRNLVSRDIRINFVFFLFVGRNQTDHKSTLFLFYTDVQNCSRKVLYSVPEISTGLLESRKIN